MGFWPFQNSQKSHHFFGILQLFVGILYIPNYCRLKILILDDVTTSMLTTPDDLGWEKPIAIGFAECLWSGRLTGHHFLGRAFIDDRRVSQESWKETFNFESPKSKIIARLFQ